MQALRNAKNERESGVKPPHSKTFTPFTSLTSFTPDSLACFSEQNKKKPAGGRVLPAK